MNIESTRAVARIASTLGDAAADAARLRDLPGTSYTAEDALRLRELVNSGPPELTAGLPRRLDVMTELDDHIETVIDPPASSVAMDSVGEALEDYLAVWRLNELPPAQRGALVERLQTTPAAQYGPDDLQALSTLTAERLPAGIPRSLPRLVHGPVTFQAALQGARDAARGRHGGQTDELQRFVDAWRVTSMSDADVAAEANRLRALPAAEYTQRDYAMLEALHGSGVVASRIDMPAALGTSTFDGLVSVYRSGSRTKPSIDMHRFMATWRTTQLDNSQLHDAASALVARDPETFDKRDWLALSAVLSANQLRGNPLRVPEKVGGFAYSFDDLVWHKTTGMINFSPSVFRPAFGDWMARLDTGWDHRARAAMFDAASGRLAAFEPNVPTAIAARFADEADMWNLPALEQVRLGVALLSVPEIHATRQAEIPFELLSSGLERLDEVAPELTQLRDETKALVDANLAMINGGATTGLAGHADYGDVGRVRASAELIERMLSTPHVAAPAVVDTEAAKLVDTIAW